jgi:hypothetical protein
MRLAKTLMERKKANPVPAGIRRAGARHPAVEEDRRHEARRRVRGEAYYLIGAAHEQAYEYDEAISLFHRPNRHRESPFAAKAPMRRPLPRRIDDDAPNDARALAEASPPAPLFSSANPIRAVGEIEASLAAPARTPGRRRLRADALLRPHPAQTESALIEYRRLRPFPPRRKPPRPARASPSSRPEKKP